MIEVADLGVLNDEPTRHRKIWLAVLSAAFSGGAVGAVVAILIVQWLSTPFPA